MIRNGGVNGSGPGLEFLAEPALFVCLEGKVRGANSAARNLFGSSLDEDGACLFDFFHDNFNDVAAYLRRASGSTSSHLGSLTVAHGAHEERFRALAARLPSVGDNAPLLILRLMQVRDDQFSVLNRRLQEMNRELHQRLKENALLAEALAENKVLLSELPAPCEEQYSADAVFDQDVGRRPVLVGCDRTRNDCIQPAPGDVPDPRSLVSKFRRKVH